MNDVVNPFEVCGVVSSLGVVVCDLDHIFTMSWFSRGRLPEKLRVGGYDDASTNVFANRQFHGHEMVSLEDSKPLPAQPVREVVLDIVMGNGGASSSNPSNVFVHRDDVILSLQDQNSRSLMLQEDRHSNCSTCCATKAAHSILLVRC